MEQALIRAMIACLSDPAAAEFGPSPRQRMAVMRRFEQVLEAKTGQALHMPELCAQLGVSDRTLRSVCQEHLGTSPHRYLWLRRMHLARRALASADRATKSVTEIAMDYGFAELGRFAVSYRRLFGETPSVTLRRPPNDRLFSGVPIAEMPVLNRKVIGVPAVSLNLRKWDNDASRSRRAMAR
jgi:AraC-like DNA-binding protein